MFIQYFTPTSRNQDVQDNYTRWDNERGLHWKIDEIESLLWEKTNTLMIEWKFQIGKDIVHSMIKIPTAQNEITNQSLTSYTLS